MANFFGKLFGKSQNTWVEFTGTLEGKQISIRVDTKYVKEMYQHTYYVRIKYSEDETITTLPTTEFLEDVYRKEDRIEYELRKISGDKVVYLGTATFGGSSYLTYASNYDIQWVPMLTSLLKEKIIGGVYLNDRMGYYNKILYPEEMRKKK